MAEEIIRKTGEDIIYKGRSIRSEAIPGPGDVDFVEQYQRADGRTFTTHQKITVPADLFEKETVELRFITALSSVEPGSAVPVRFEITKGNLYPGDQIFVHFSSEGSTDPLKFKVLEILNYDRTDFSFRPKSDVSSEHCFLALQVKDSTGAQLGTALSREFPVQKAVPVIFKINPFQREIMHGETVPITFEWSNPQRISKFRCMLNSFDPKFTKELPDISPLDRAFSLVVPPDVKGDAVTLVLFAVDLTGKGITPFARSDPFKVKEREEFSISAIKTEVEQGETITLPFTWYSSKSISGFSILLVNSSTALERVIPPLLNPSDRSCTFSIPRDVDGRGFVIALYALDSSNIPIQFVHTNLFTIKKMALPDIDLLRPTTRNLHAGTRVELAWRMTHPTIANFKTRLLVSYTIGRVEFPIEEKTDASDRGITNWTLPAILPDPTQAMIILSMPDVSVRKEFGIFTITGGKEPGPPEEIKDDLGSIDNLLKTIRIPAKRSFFGTITPRSVGDFLYHIVNTDEIDKYFTVHNRLREIAEILAKEEFKTKFSVDKNYQEFFRHVENLSTIRPKLEGLEDKKELRGRLKEMLNLFLQTKNMKKNLMGDFVKIFGAEPSRFNADLLLRKTTGKDDDQGINYLSWFIQHAPEVDEIVLENRGPSLFKMVDLYQWLRTVLVDAENMYAELLATRNSINALKKIMLSSR